MNQKFINSVCFVRSYDYYGKYDPVNLTALEGQMRIYQHFSLPATYLLEYDALERPEFPRLLERRSSGDEVGLWFEITGGLCRDAGVPWRSKRDRDWDFYVDPGCIMAYSLGEKVKLCDAAMKKFHAVFGFYPKTVGAWLLDSEAMDYLTSHYGMDAYIICREQWGMDGYTLWGGPYFGGYYPSKNNMLSPAQSTENRIDTPVFRMYLSDPIYSYYEFTHGQLNGMPYHLFTQEPTWRYGQDPVWVRWCLDSLFGPDSQGFLCYHLGQETPFGFSQELERALTMQCAFAVENQKRYGCRLATVGQTGREFRSLCTDTPAAFVACQSDWAENGNQSVWYCSRRYRVNLFARDGRLWIRDLHLFDDAYRDRYLDDPCRSRKAIYDNLPLVDGVRFTWGCDEKDIPANEEFHGKRYGDPAGLYLEDTAKITGVQEFSDGLYIRINYGQYLIILRPEELELRKDQYQQFQMRFLHKTPLPYLHDCRPHSLIYRHRSYEYSLELENGIVNGDLLLSENSRLTLKFGNVKPL